MQQGRMVFVRCNVVVLVVKGAAGLRWQWVAQWRFVPGGCWGQGVGSVLIAVVVWGDMDTVGVEVLFRSQVMVAVFALGRAVRERHTGLCLGLNNARPRPATMLSV